MGNINPCCDYKTYRGNRYRIIKKESKELLTSRTLNNEFRNSSKSSKSPKCFKSSIIKSKNETNEQELTCTNLVESNNNQETSIDNVKGKVSTQTLLNTQIIKKIKSHPISILTPKYKNSDFVMGNFIGEGKFAKVYQGLCELNGKIVAIKFYYKISDNKKHLIKQHINKLYSLKHPNLIKAIPVIDYDNESNRISLISHRNSSKNADYIIDTNNMNDIISNRSNSTNELNNNSEENLKIIYEYCSGNSLSSLLKIYGTRDEKLINLYTKQILEGLEYLHKNNIAHKNINLNNILVENNGLIKLSDSLTDSIILGDKEEFLNYFYKNKIINQNQENIINEGNYEPKINFYIPPFFVKAIKNNKLNKNENDNNIKNNINNTDKIYNDLNMSNVITNNSLSNNIIDISLFKAYDLWCVGCIIIEIFTGKNPWSHYKFNNQQEFIDFLNQTHLLPTIPKRLSQDCQEFLNILFDYNQTSKEDIFDKIYALNFFNHNNNNNKSNNNKNKNVKTNKINNNKQYNKNITNTYDIKCNNKNSTYNNLLINNILQNQNVENSNNSQYCTKYNSCDFPTINYIINNIADNNYSKDKINIKKQQLTNSSIFLNENSPNITVNNNIININNISSASSSQLGIMLGKGKVVNFINGNDNSGFSISYIGDMSQNSFNNGSYINTFGGNNNIYNTQLKKNNTKDDKIFKEGQEIYGIKEARGEQSPLTPDIKKSEVFRFDEGLSPYFSWKTEIDNNLKYEVYHKLNTPPQLLNNNYFNKFNESNKNIIKNRSLCYFNNNSIIINNNGDSNNKDTSSKNKELNNEIPIKVSNYVKNRKNNQMYLFKKDSSK